MVTNDRTENIVHEVIVSPIAGVVNSFFRVVEYDNLTETCENASIGSQQRNTDMMRNEA